MKGSHIALAGLVALAYAGCFVAISIGLQYAPPLQFAGWRALVAGITLLLVARLSGRPCRRAGCAPGSRSSPPCWWYSTRQCS